MFCFRPPTWRCWRKRANYLLIICSTLNLGTVVVQIANKDLSDSCWHFVQIRRRRRRFTIILDRGENGRDARNLSGKLLTLNLNNQSNVIYYGGGPEEALRYAQARTLSFNGFLKGVKFEEFNVIDNALKNEHGFSISDSDGVPQAFPSNMLLRSVEGQCSDASGCSPSEDDSDSCTPSPKSSEGTF